MSGLGRRAGVGKGCGPLLWSLLWSLLLSVMLLGPALGPGYVLHRDMVWVPDLALGRADVLGLGSALPRAVPSDAVIAALDEVIPAMLIQKLVLLGSLVGAGLGAAALVGGRTAPRLAVASVAIWNPFVVERLGMGHWPVLLGYAAVPWLVIAGRCVAARGTLPGWALLVLVLGSLSANAGLVSGATLLITALAGGGRGRGAWRRTAVLVAAVAAANAPWIVAGFVHAAAAADAAGYRAFATSGDGLPGPLAALTLGGIWNGDVVPDSRHGVLPWFGLLLLVLAVVAGGRRWWRASGPRQGGALVVLWSVGVGVAVVSWAVPGVLADLGGWVPGGALLRDGTRELALALPLTVGIVAAAVERLCAWAPQRLAAGALALAVVAAPVALMTDAAWGLGGSLRAAHYPAEWLAARARVASGHGAALLVPLSNYRAPAWNGGQPVIDPLARVLAVDVTLDDDLVVDGVGVPGEDPAARAARAALGESTPDARAIALRRAGIGWVVSENDAGGDVPEVAGSVVHDGPLLRIIRLDGLVQVPSAGMPARVAQGLAWIAFLLVVGCGAARAAGRSVRMATGRHQPARLRD
ncbi:hypothetical protein [Nocardioides sp. Kera G14]|uniref:hypothetical protein n=1 Tax=Nocardioides sp. Kera G14 TaxID=2884264 RepID=UPI001D0FA101|nr:hypothetical protein [Nocardioides sp. Kera G14]UDY22427.1 hypothetical protein LH076_10075 [Nocardioides sp. Kera G14]